jgi:glycosyltransferase involved in cell wall biosynthesis
MMTGALTSEVVNAHTRERLSIPTVLVLSPYYLPARRSGGPVRSLSNMVAHLGEEFRFQVLTRDREFDDRSPFPDVRAGAWHRVGKADVRYLAPAELSFGGWRRHLCETPVGATPALPLLYLNSFFSPSFTIKPLLLRRFGLLPRLPFVLAPRGEFSPGALAIHARKKRAYLALTKAIGLYDGLLWHASTPLEEGDIRRCIGQDCRVIVSPYFWPAESRREASGVLPAPSDQWRARGPRQEERNVLCSRLTPHASRLKPLKAPGKLEIAFVSRISRKKNLDGALRMLHGVEGDLQFNIYGSVEDEAYWAECRDLIRRLPPNIRVQWHGALDHADALEAMRQNQLFFLPTLGENFGRVIIEAMLEGCPVLISDQTPWRNLAERGAGWDLPLDRDDLFRQALRACVAMDAARFREHSRRAREYGLSQSDNAAAIDGHRALFQAALGKAAPGS